jgi:hypothetical protein
MPWRFSNSTRTAANRRCSSVSASAVNCSPALRGRDTAGNQPCRNEETLLLPDDAGAIDDLLIVAAFAEKGIDLGNQHGRAVDLIGEGRVDQAIDDVGAVDYRLSHARGGGHEGYQHAPELLVIAQQREELNAGWQARQESYRSVPIASSALPVSAMVFNSAGNSSVRWAREAAARVAA